MMKTVLGMGLLSRRKSLIDELNGYEASKLKDYAEKNGLSLDDALKEIIKKGIRYIDLEEAYGEEGIEDRELWDKRYHFLKIESAYLHYRLLLKEALDELRKLLLTFSSVVGGLELCYRSLPQGRGGELREEEIRKLKALIDMYVNKLLKPSEEELRNSDISDEDVIKDIEDLVKRYKEVFKHAAEEEKEG